MENTMRQLVSIASLLLLLTLLHSTASAQWVKIPLPNTPRTPDGKPNLGAPLPRAVDGKPDLGGVWAAVSDRSDVPVTSVPIPRNRHGSNIAVDVPGGPPLTPWAKAIYDARRKAEGKGLPTEKCLPSGIPPDMLRPSLPFKIVQTYGVTIILLEEFNNWRQIFTDGRALPVDPQPAWFGYSVAKWDGDSLVVSTAGFNDQTWLDSGGTPHSEMLRLTEHFRRIDFGHMEVQYSFDDPMAFTKPWS